MVYGGYTVSSRPVETMAPTLRLENSPIVASGGRCACAVARACVGAVQVRVGVSVTGVQAADAVVDKDVVVECLLWVCVGVRGCEKRCGAGGGCSVLTRSTMVKLTFTRGVAHSLVGLVLLNLEWLMCTCVGCTGTHASLCVRGACVL